MFFEDKTVESVDQIICEVKKYITLQKEYTKLEVVEKVTAILSTVLMLLVIIVLTLMTLFYLLISLAYLLAPHVGGMATSFAIIAGISAILIVITILFKDRIFVRPFVRFMTNLFFKPKKNEL